jgi:hypothetical protein
LGSSFQASCRCIFLVKALKTVICSSSNEHEMGRAIARMGEKRNAYRLLVGKLEEKRPLGRPRRRWVDNIKLDLREIEWSFMDWIDWSRIGTSGGLL